MHSIGIGSDWNSNDPIINLRGLVALTNLCRQIENQIEMTTIKYTNRSWNQVQRSGVASDKEKEEVGVAGGLLPGAEERTTKHKRVNIAPAAR